jgi:hypothetical protein
MPREISVTKKQLIIALMELNVPDSTEVLVLTKDNHLAEDEAIVHIRIGVHGDYKDKILLRTYDPLSKEAMEYLEKYDGE